MNNLYLYFALFWALGLILMGLYFRFYLRKKREQQFKDKYRNGLIVMFILSALSQNTLAASELTVEQTAYDLLYPPRSSAEIIHPSAWLRDVFRYGHLLPDYLQRELIKKGYRIARNSNSRLLSTRSEAVGLDQYVDNGIFRFHYTIQGTKGVDSTDIDQNTIPDYIDIVMMIVDEVYRHQINDLGYVPPPDDGRYLPDQDNGGSAHYDIYVTNLSYGYYGYVQADQEIGDNPNSSAMEQNAYSSYMAVRNNYDGFPNSEINNLRVTIAHEFFHSIQFGYDAWEKSWLMEATAVWMEESVYDDINDCYQYMPEWFASPHSTLAPEAGTRWYGSFIYFEYIDEHLGGHETIRRIWENSVKYNSYNMDDSRLIIDNALITKSSDFVDSFNGMAIANRILSADIKAGAYRYDEADAYIDYADKKNADDFPLVETIVYFTRGSRDTISSSNLERYGSNYIFLNTNDPVEFSLIPGNGNATDFMMSVILKDSDGNYIIKSGPVMNIDPRSNNYTWMYIVVSSIAQNVTRFNYNIAFRDGNNEVGDPEGFEILAIYPNPYQLKKDGNWRNIRFRIHSYGTNEYHISVINLLGQHIKTLYKDILNKNDTKIITWSGKNELGNLVSSGAYFLIVKSDRQIEYRQITVLN